MKIFLCGDVMIGRGIDQALPSPCPPQLHEKFVGSAVDYLKLAERKNGPIRTPVDLSYVWGDCLEELARAKPDARVINLETSITRCEAFDRKGINYRVSPENAACLNPARIDCCLLANNHILDWTRVGLLDTLGTLDRLRMRHAGAGRDLEEASKPAILENVAGRRLLIFSFASTTSGVPRDWAAGPALAGLNLLPNLAEETVGIIAQQARLLRQASDVVIVSIHWGGNWGHDVPKEHTRFAHDLVDRAGVTIVHGHSSHHAKAIELYKNGLILYGCGDFINDYEGIEGYEEFRGDLAVMYFAQLDPSGGTLISLELVPLQIRRFRLARAAHADTAWLQQTLDRESRRFGTRIDHIAGARFAAYRAT
jgi:poly-gamma-glutamate synthesis protein (capsule biosynthesis protein)